MSHLTAVIFRNRDRSFDVRFGTAWLPNQVEVVGFAVKKHYSDGGLPHQLTLHPQLQLILNEPVFDSSYSEYYLGNNRDSLLAAMKKATDGLYDLNNGYIAHRIEDRLGFDRGSVSIAGDEDGNLTATHWVSGKQIEVLSQDNQPY